jgi:hypothetical protein
MLIDIISSWLRITLAPPTIACFDSPDFRDWHARCRATKLAEQAVSIDMDGPLRLKK